ncbi:hypothetical protein Ef30038_19270 [Escherichia fergusonii]|nr:hypothetical protein Ef30038_19270 [Escherichia fergusonii]
MRNIGFESCLNKFLTLYSLEYIYSIKIQITEKKNLLRIPIAKSDASKTNAITLM